MEQDALNFIKTLQAIYLEQRDMDKILDSITNNTSWIGTGEHEICENIIDASEALFADKSEYQDGFTVLDSWYKVEPLQPDAYVVYGEFWAEPKNSTADMAELHHRVSAVCIKTPQGMKLLHLHMSRPDNDQLGQEYYVKNQTKADNKTLLTRYEQTTKKLRDRNREMEILTSNIPGGVHQTKNDEALTILSMSSGFIGMFGYTKEDIVELFDNKFLNMIYEEDRAAFVTVCKDQLSHGQTVEFEYRVPCKNGKLMWVLDRGRLVTAEDGTESFFCMMLDVTDRKKEQEELRLMLERHNVIMDQTRDIIFEWNIVADTIDFSSNWEKKFGYLPISKKISAKIPLSENIHPNDIGAFVKIMKDTAAGVPYSEAEFRIRNLSCFYTWCKIRATTQFDSNNHAIKAVGVIIDIDDEKHKSHALIEAAQRDALTKLYNKNATKVKIEHLLEEKSDGIFHALMIIDVDNFKTVNDRFGHQCGDAVLSNMAESLKKLFRATDIIGRIGGDEFLVFMPHLNGMELAAAKANAIVKIFGEMPLEISVDLSCSVGVSIYPSDALDYTGLSRCADIALYHVKNNGKVNFALYEKEMQESVPDSIIRTAINETTETTPGLNSELLQRAFEMLYNTPDIHSSINKILEIIGRAYDVSRVYVFESSEDGKRCSNTYEWCNEGITPQINNLQELCFDTDLKGFFDLYDENGVFYCQNIDALSPNLRDVLEAQGITSVLQCFIQDDNCFEGYVGFDECNKNRYWTKEQIHTLTLVANVLSTFLIKARLKEQLAALKKRL